MLKGTLDDFSLPDVFRLMSLSKKTGRLEVRRKAGSGHVFFRDGEVYYAESSISREPLGQKLIKIGALTEGQLRKALDEHQESGQRVGDILVSTGVVSEADIRGAVEQQVEDAVFDLLRWELGDFLWEGGAEVDVEVPIGVSVENLIMEASRRLDELELIKRKIPSEYAILAMAPKPPEGSLEINITPEEWRVLVLVDGSRPITAIADTVGDDVFEAMRTMYGLVSAGLVEVVDPGDGTDLHAPGPGAEEMPGWAPEASPDAVMSEQPAAEQEIPETPSPEQEAPETAFPAAALEALVEEVTHATLEVVADEVPQAEVTEPPAEAEADLAQALEGTVVSEEMVAPEVHEQVPSAEPDQPLIVEAGAVDDDSDPSLDVATPPAEWFEDPQVETFDAPGPDELLTATPEPSEAGSPSEPEHEMGGADSFLADLIGSISPEEAGSEEAPSEEIRSEEPVEAFGEIEPGSIDAPVAEVPEPPSVAPAPGPAGDHSSEGQPDRVDRAAVVRELAGLFDEDGDAPRRPVRRVEEPPSPEEDEAPATPKRVEDDENVTKGLISRLIEGVKGL